MDELKQLSVLVIDPSGHSRRLLKTIFASIGISKIECLGRTDEAISILRDQFFDIVFCDECGGPLDPDKFVKALRCDLATADVTVPVILVSVGTSRERASSWRDAGGSDIIIKPISTEVMQIRLKALVCGPRSFVATKGFIGPDRRRDNAERRQFGERRPPVRDRRGAAKDGTVFALTPDKS